jgi:LuxR family maltose regulon positive regulatory protein
MLVEGRTATVATAFVPFIRAYVALLGHHDPEAALAGSSEARRLAKATGAVDLEMLALALEGLSLVSVGQVGEGMSKLDAAAAAAVGGEMTDADSIETVCCFVIDACKRVRDLERANEWCHRVREIAVRFGDRQMFAVCRTHYADVLLWHGEWALAEAELLKGVEELGRLRPGRDEDPLVRLAELRRRQGRAAESSELLDRAPSHRLQPLVAGLLALDRGNAAGARAAADRFLRRVGARDRFERVAGLELLVRAALASGDTKAARNAADEIASIAEATPNAPLRATALLAEGRLAAAALEHSLAQALLEDAADLFDAAGARYDAGIARLEHAAALRAAGRTSDADRAERTARDGLLALGATVAARPAGDLSRREREVLRLVAHGDSNEQIARALVLSVRTVERHVANVYAKIGVSGRTARAAATAWAHTNGIA